MSHQTARLASRGFLANTRTGSQSTSTSQRDQSLGSREEKSFNDEGSFVLGSEGREARIGGEEPEGRTTKEDVCRS